MTIKVENSTFYLSDTISITIRRKQLSNTCLE